MWAFKRGLRLGQTTQGGLLTRPSFLQYFLITVWNLKQETRQHGWRMAKVQKVSSRATSWAGEASGNKHEQTS
jgi:hypothetical protein